LEGGKDEGREGGGEGAREGGRVVDREHIFLNDI